MFVGLASGDYLFRPDAPPRRLATTTTTTQTDVDTSGLRCWDGKVEWMPRDLGNGELICFPKDR